MGMYDYGIEAKAGTAGVRGLSRSRIWLVLFFSLFLWVVLLGIRIVITFVKNGWSHKIFLYLGCARRRLIFFSLFALRASLLSLVGFFVPVEFYDLMTIFEVSSVKGFIFPWQISFQQFPPPIATRVTILHAQTIHITIHFSISINHKSLCVRAISLSQSFLYYFSHSEPLWIVV